MKQLCFILPILLSVNLASEVKALTISTIKVEVSMIKKVEKKAKERGSGRDHENNCKNICEVE